MAGGAIVYLLRYAATGISLLLLNVFIIAAYPIQQVGWMSALLVVGNLSLLVCDLGVGAALIQSRRRPDAGELSSIYSLLFSWWAAAWLPAAAAAWFVGDGIFAVLVVATAAWPLNILRQLSTVVREQELDFRTLAGLEVAETGVLVCVTLACAATPIGIWGFAFALLARACAGWALSARFRAAAIILGLPRRVATLPPLVRFGLSYHTGNLLTAVRQLVNPVVVGALLGMAAVGLVDRSVFIAGAPLLVLGAVQQRLLFPFFSAIQQHPERTRGSFERALSLSSLLDKLLYLPLLIVLGPLVKLALPAVWHPLVPLVWLTVLPNVVLGAIAFTALPLLNGLGRADIVARLNLTVSVAAWLLVWPLTAAFGVLGAVLVNLVLWTSTIAILGAVKRLVPGVAVWSRIVRPLAAFVAVLAGSLLALAWGSSAGIGGVIAALVFADGVLPPAAVLAAAAGAPILYLLTMRLLDPRSCSDLRLRPASPA